MPKIQYKEIRFQQKSLDLIELREKEELKMLERNYDRAVAYLESEE